jgi:hypothetical protein
MLELEYLSLKRSNTATVVPELLCGFVRNCQNLLYFYCDDLRGTDDALYALAQTCSSLRSLHYGHAARDSIAGLEAVLLACEDLHTVDFTSPAGFSNAHVATVVQHC